MIQTPKLEAAYFGGRVLWFWAGLYGDRPWRGRGVVGKEQG